MRQLGTDGTNFSRLGFKAEEDLGGGLRAGVWLERALKETNMHHLTEAQWIAIAAHRLRHRWRSYRVQSHPSGSHSGASNPTESENAKSWRKYARMS